MATPKLTYDGKVEGGVIKLPSQRLREGVVQAFDGKPIAVTFERKKKTRTNSQNSYYWSVVIPCIVRGIRELGNDVQEGNKEHHEAVHDMLKGELLANGIDIVGVDGLVKQLPPSTTRASTVEFMDYMARVQIWAGEFLGITIPEPNEHLSETI